MRGGCGGDGEDNVVDDHDDDVDDDDDVGGDNDDDGGKNTALEIPLYLASLTSAAGTPLHHHWLPICGAHPALPN